MIQLSSTEIKDIFQRFEGLNVVIIGDVMLDRYWYGKVNRISPEAPVPVVEYQRTETRLGGAANVALNIKAMGATPYIFTVIGKDEESQIFLKIMQENGLSVRGVLQNAERPTTIKTRIVGGNQQMLRLDSETTTDITMCDEDSLLKKLSDFLEINQIDVIVFQDYNKGVLTARIIREVTLQALRHDIPTTVDPKKKNFLEYRQCTLFKPNLKEIREAVNFSIDPTSTSLQKASDFLTQKIGNAYTMITLSEKGVFMQHGQDSFIQPTHARNISDVSGAGDTVISVASLALALGLSPTLIATLANMAGGQVCEYAGVVPVNKEKLRADLIKNTIEYQ